MLNIRLSKVLIISRANGIPNLTYDFLLVRADLEQEKFSA